MSDTKVATHETTTPPSFAQGSDFGTRLLKTDRACEVVEMERKQDDGRGASYESRVGIDLETMVHFLAIRVEESVRLPATFQTTRNAGCPGCNKRQNSQATANRRLPLALSPYANLSRTSCHGDTFAPTLHLVSLKTRK